MTKIFIHFIKNVNILFYTDTREWYSVMHASDEMTAFVQVVDKGSFAEAAKELSLTPSAVSKTITRLEQRLGIQLLTRTTRRLALTNEGQTFLIRCREILAAIEAAEAEAALSGTTPRGYIRISSGAVLGRSQIAAMLPDFHARFPDITVELRISEQTVDLMAENIDVALRGGELPDSSLIGRKLLDASRVICASPSYLAQHGTPERPEDLVHHNCILFSNVPHLARWPFFTPEGERRVQVRGNVVTDSADVMVDLAIAGHGIIRMIDIRLMEAIRDQLLVPLFTEVHTSEAVPLWAVTPPERNRLPRVRAFLDFLVERFDKLPHPKA
jgi:DNA-binding transcriptional LysR family regulator